MNKGLEPPMRMNGAIAAIAATGLALILPTAALAQGTDPALAGLTLADGADSGDTAWMLVSSALVLLMAAPGLALFYGGRTRAGNALSIASQIGGIVAVSSLLWVVVGYTLAFGQVSGGWIGAGNAWMLIALGDVRDGTSVAESAFVLFQSGLAAFAPALLAGAWLGRARFGWVLGFAALWGLLVYAPVAHWVWGGGWLAAKLGTVDFAGGLVVHTTAGVSALVVALLLGRRIGFPGTPESGHSPMLAMAGAALLWIGWFGMVGGAALTASDDAASAIIAAHVAACAGGLARLLIDRLTGTKPGPVAFASGALAGLVAASPAAQFIAPGAAMIFGAVAAVACRFAARLISERLAIDDSLGVFAVHGVGGMLGALLVAVFMTPSLGGTGFAAGMTMGKQMAAQVIGIGVVALWSAVASAIAALMVSLVIPMRVSEADEAEGLDLASHGAPRAIPAR